MKGRGGGLVEFPANPFVALADFLFLLAMLLILAVVQQSLATSEFQKRIAIGVVQKELIESFSSSNVLRQAFDSRHEGAVVRGSSGAIGTFRSRMGVVEWGSDGAAQSAGLGQDLWECYFDGDLQRFRIRGGLCFDSGSSVLKPRATSILAALGKVLAEKQANEHGQLGYGLFKRVEVHGNTDPHEVVADSRLGASADSDRDQRCWALSLERARAAVGTMTAAGLREAVVVASGSGRWEPVADDGTPDDRRIDIVVVYSGQRALDYKDAR